ncbi:Peptidase_M28 domain-containing protein [Meloidogyne graminicola]|uniref:BOS complex subunit NCLN n=1 Tax=Meloidogyne graminicola TaxID=189291 RepID=A0A8S9ZNA3_9BILA|nr:Peptidase_M28 domain-containing protein [Meloidogyne graminicola]
MSEEQLFDVLRNLWTICWLWFLIPSGVFGILNSGTITTINLNKMEIEIRAFRLQQYETSGKFFGSKSWKVIYQAVDLNESALRKCVVIKWWDLINIDFEDKFSAVLGAVLVILPKDLNELSEKEYQTFLSIEQKFVSLRTELAVYFAPNSTELVSLLSSVSTNSIHLPSTTAFQQLINSIMADNYQITSTNSATTNLLTNSKIYNIIGQLNAQERGLPFIFIVAYYDTFGVVPGLTIGSDSNGSGVAVLLELLRIFNYLYSLPSHNARYNLVFVLSAGGKFSFQGSRSFIDDFNEKYSDEKIALAICLDSLGKRTNSNLNKSSINIHLSKLPSSTSLTNKFISNLQNFEGNKTINLLTKKINLAADRLAWEHEIYNIRRIHSLTISHFEKFDDPERNSMLDIPKNLDYSILEENAHLIANSLISFIFQLETVQCLNLKEKKCSLLLNKQININKKRLETWINLFASKPRPTNELLLKNVLINNLFQVVKKYSENALISEVIINDFVLYEINEDKLSGNIVKPAIFELLLAAGICVYLYVVYLLAFNAQKILEGSIYKIKKYL